MATEKVRAFLSKHNRPFSINDIVQGLADQSIGKSKVQKSLEQLVAENKAIEKVYSKQKIYCIAQDTSQPPEKANQEILEVNRQSTQLEGKLNEMLKKLQSVDSELKQFDTGFTLEEVTSMKSDLKDEIGLLERRLESCNSSEYSKDEAGAITKEYGEMAKEYRKRKKLCNEIIAAIFENYPKTKKQLLEEIGIETDEDVGFVMKNLD